MKKRSIIPLFVSFCLVPIIFFLAGNKQPNRIKTNQDSSKIKIPEGFHIQHLYSPKKHDQGSWIAMTFDDKGRMITSDQYGNLYRLTIPPIGSKDSVKVESLPVSFLNDTSTAKTRIGYAHGLLYANHSLYVMVNDEGEPDSLTRQSGLYRLLDTNGNGVYDEIKLLKPIDGRGEHGPHSIVLGPDGKSIYILAGNYTKMPRMDVYRLPTNWEVDNLLPKLYDPRGFGNNLKPPGGWIAKMNPDGSNWTLVSAGFRNPFDMAFNKNGDLFTYDSDMEWDLGLPWYRPTRICLVVPGSDFGYRENDHKWSPLYPDNLPPILNVGQGSPTDVMTAYNAGFPNKYRKGLYYFDWTYGIIYHVKLTPYKSYYKVKQDVFASGSPLPLVDGVIGPDGAMYFVTGGRRLQSNLYRIYYGNGHMAKKPLHFKNDTKTTKKARKTRKMLEKLQVKQVPNAVNIAWHYLASNDRFIRYTARKAIEHRPVTKWKQKALNEKDPIASIYALLALAKNGNKSLESSILNKLISIDYNNLNHQQKIALLRTIEVTLARMGKPDGKINEKLIAYLDPKFPASKKIVNRLFSKVLAYIGDPNAVKKMVTILGETPKKQSYEKTATESSNLIYRNFKYGTAIAHMLANTPPAQHVYYAVVLSGAKKGWTPELRKEYFSWIKKVFKDYKGGHSFVGYINEARKHAIDNATKTLAALYNSISGDSLLSSSGNDLASSVPQPKGPGRAWKVDSALVLVQSGLHNRDYKDGKNMFLSLSCGSCHRVGNIGEGDIGPDLSRVGRRFSYKDMLESIINPSKSISSQYAATKFSLKNGGAVVGRLIKKENGNYYISQNPYAPQKNVKVPVDSVIKTSVSKTSIMPKGLINRLNPDELKDLLAFLKSGGNKKDEVFKDEK
jgi:putative heme-binding domain-containing protein